MPTYVITDNKTGKEFEFDGDSPPSEQEILSGLAAYSQQAPKREEQTPKRQGFVSQLKQRVSDDVKDVGAMAMEGGTGLWNTGVRAAKGLLGAANVPYQMAVNDKSFDEALNSSTGLINSDTLNINSPIESRVTKAIAPVVTRGIQGASNMTGISPEALGQGLQAAGDIATLIGFKPSVLTAARTMPPSVKGAVKAVTKPKATMADVAAWAEKKADKAARISAAKQLELSPATHPVIQEQSAVNRAVTEEAMQDFPGTRLTDAQITGDPALLKLQQDSQLGTIEGKLGNEAQLMNNASVIQDTVNPMPPQGDIYTFLEGLDAEAAARRNAVGSIQRGFVGDKPELGATGRQLATGVKDALKEKANSLYAPFKNELIDTTDVYNTIQKLGDTLDPAFRRPAEIPSGIMNRANGALAPDVPTGPYGTIQQWAEAKNAAAGAPNQATVGNLLELKSQVGKAYSAANAAGDFSKAQPLKQLLDGIGQTMRKAEQDLPGLMDGNNFYRDTYAPTVYQGGTAKVLAKDTRGFPRVADADVMKQYFKQGNAGYSAADSFQRTLGTSPEAISTLKQYAKTDLMDAATDATTGQLNMSKVDSWLYNHKPAIDRLGLATEFDGIKAALTRQDEIASFAKTMKQTDPQRFIKNIFAVENPEATMVGLVQAIKGQPAKVRAGLENAYTNYMMDELQSYKTNMAGDFAITDRNLEAFWQKHSGAMAYLFSKEKMNTMRNMRTVVEAENRVLKPTSGTSGSQTRDAVSLTNRGLKAFAGLNLQGRVLRAALSGAFKWKDELTQNYLARMQFDPAFANEVNTLLKESRGSTTKFTQGFSKAVARAAAAGLLSTQTQDSNNAQ